MKHLRMVCAWIALAAWLAPAAAIGQTTTGTILGDVKDSTGGSLPGVTVTAVNQANGLTREAVTDELGNYRFSAMPAGLYTVKASLTGFKEASRADVRVNCDSDGSVSAIVTDDGVGIHETAGAHHYGLTIMEERARNLGGQLRVENLPDIGTRVTLHFKPSTRRDVVIPIQPLSI